MDYAQIAKHPATLVARGELHAARERLEKAVTPDEILEANEDLVQAVLTCARVEAALKLDLPPDAVAKDAQSEFEAVRREAERPVKHDLTQVTPPRGSTKAPAGEAADRYADSYL
jgi:hypothetical protein